jgi:hypothetical protein
MQFQPTLCDGTIQAGAVFRGRALVAEQERAIDLLDMDSAILNRFEGVRMLHQATRAFSGSEYGRSVAYFIGRR